MSDENNKNNEGAGGDAAAQAVAAKATADKAAADKVAADAAAAAGEETITIKKSELEKIKSDRDNYQKGLLQKKADERNLGNQGGEGKGDGSGQGAGQGDGNVIDEKKITDTATAAVSKTLRGASEKTAKRAFLQAHPEYVADADWQGLMSYLTFKGGELTHDEIFDRMDAALLEHKRATGKLDEYLDSVKEKARQEGRVEGQFNSARAAGSSGDNRNNFGSSGGFSSGKGEEMARAMHTDPEKAKKIDPLKDNVINVV